MNGLAYAGAALVVLAAGLMIFFNLTSRGARKRSTLRYIPAFQRLRRQAGLAVEEGQRLHVSLGHGSLMQRGNASSLVGLSALERMSHLSMVSDRPAMASSGDGALALLSQDVLRNSHRTHNLIESYHPRYAQLTGVTPFSYMAGTLPLLQQEQISVNLFTGGFGPEISLLNDAAEQQNAFVLAASDRLAAQAVMYAACQEPLLGEELFALPAYIQSNTMQHASLRAEDVLRWLLILLLLGGAAFSILQFFGVL